MKKLVLEVVDGGFDMVMVRVAEQTHINNEFGEDEMTFIAKNSFRLHSENRPAYHGVYSLCVRGRLEEYNLDIILFPVDKLPALKEAVEEYNEYFFDKEAREEVETAKVKRYFIGK